MKQTLHIKKIAEIYKNWKPPVDFSSVSTEDEVKGIMGQATGKLVDKVFMAMGIDIDARRMEIFGTEDSPSRGDKIQKLFEMMEIKFVDDVPPLPPTSDEMDTDDPSSFVDVGLKSMNVFLRSCNEDKWVNLNEDGKLEYTTLDFKENLPLDITGDCYFVTDKVLSTKLVAITPADKHKEAIAVGRLEKKDGKYYITFSTDEAKICYDEFKGESLFSVLLFEEDIENVFSTDVLVDIANNAIKYSGTVYTYECAGECTPIEECSSPLCIDFGTSNTAVGSYDTGKKKNHDHKPEVVEFYDCSTGMYKQLCPTLVYVNKVDKENHEVEYLFGYEAEKVLKECEYDTGMASVFFEIKRWMDNLDEEVDVCDKKGKHIKVVKRTIVKAYLDFVIHEAVKYFGVKFKKLHISAPVKLKNTFYEEFGKIFAGSGLELVPLESTIDEAFSIVYKCIRNLVYAKKLSKENPKISLLIMDCGGGTTDLASCNVNRNPKSDGRNASLYLDIETQFANGDSCFGGNNLTYRILQLVKIKLAGKLAPQFIESTISDKLGLCLSEECHVQSLITKDDIEILNEIDGYQHSLKNKEDMQREINAVYDKFEECYALVEEIIPTRYDDYKRKPMEYNMVKRNFYYLWKLAESLKIRFYEEGLVLVGGDKRLDNLGNLNYYLFRRDGNKLVKNDIKDLYKGVEITINELRHLLCGDIYQLLNYVFDNNLREIGNYDYYRLSGQSCKIQLFMDLMKEFVPGYKLRTNEDMRKLSNQDSKSLFLKLDCLEGSILYMRDKSSEFIYPEISQKPSKLIYNVYGIKDLDGIADNTMLLLEAGDSEIGCIGYDDKATECYFKITDGYGKIVKEDHFAIYDIEDEDEKSLDDIFKIVSEQANNNYNEKNSSEESALDRLKKYIGDNEIAECKQKAYIFAVPCAGYGLVFYQIDKYCENNSNHYYYHRYKTISFESMNTTFFDGRK